MQVAPLFFYLVPTLFVIIFCCVIYKFRKYIIFGAKIASERERKREREREGERERERERKKYWPVGEQDKQENESKRTLWRKIYERERNTSEVFGVLQFIELKRGKSKGIRDREKGERKGYTEEERKSG